MYGDRESYDKLWCSTIRPALDRFIERVPKLSLKKDYNILKENIWNTYTELNEKAKNTYMYDSNGRLDRHKVSVCYMFAILKTYPLKVNEDIQEDDIIITINEHLAIEIGLSVLRAFLVTPGSELTEQEQNDIEIFKDGFVFPTAQNGVYRNNFALELYFTKKENAYNILSLSHSLFLLEEYNRIKYQNNQ